MLQDFEYNYIHNIRQNNEDNEVNELEVEKNIKHLDTKLLIIDSNDRNKAEYPNSSEYEIFLDQTFRNVVSIELVQAYVNDEQYNITNSNNKLNINELNCFIPNGFYTFIQLKDKINHLLTLYNIQNILCEFDEISKKFFFYATSFEDLENLSMNFRGNTLKKKIYQNNLSMYVEYNPPIYNYCDNSIGKKLGFSAKKYTYPSFSCNFDGEPPPHPITSSPYSQSINLSNEDYTTLLNICSYNYNFIEIYIDGHVFKTTDIQFLDGQIKVNENIAGNQTIKINCIISDFAANLNFDDFILLNISNLNRYICNNKKLNNSFALIPQGKTQKYFDISRNYGTIKNLDPILPQLNKLSIQFTDTKGNLYDFNNQEHKLIFGITYKLVY